jgi:hypothetical protein
VSCNSSERRTMGSSSRMTTFSMAIFQRKQATRLHEAAK